MIEFGRIEINELQYIANYLLQNKNNFQQVVADFGDVENINGYGTSFLYPKNPLFKVIYVHSKDGQISSAGFGGPQLGLSLKSLLTAYKKINEGYVPYDEEYIYVFCSFGDLEYTVKISSKEKLLEKGEILNDIPINEFVITLS